MGSGGSNLSGGGLWKEGRAGGKRVHIFEKMGVRVLIFPIWKLKLKEVQCVAKHHAVSKLQNHNLSHGFSWIPHFHPGLRLLSWLLLVSAPLTCHFLLGQAEQGMGRE